MLKIFPNPDPKEYDEITQAVKDNNGFCPCDLSKTEATKCPCQIFRERTTEGFCHCGRYLKKNVED